MDAIEILVLIPISAFFGTAAYLSALYGRYEYPDSFEKQTAKAIEMFPQAVVILFLLVMFSPVFLYYRLRS